MCSCGSHAPIRIHHSFNFPQPVHLNVHSLSPSCTVCTPPPLLILSLIVCIVCVHVGYPHQFVWFENVFSMFHLFSLHKCSVDPVYVIASYTFSTVYHTKVQYLNPICGCVVVYMQYWFVAVNCVCLCVMCVLCVFLGIHEHIVHMSTHSTHLSTSELMYCICHKLLSRSVF